MLLPMHHCRVWLQAVRLAAHVATSWATIDLWDYWGRVRREGSDFLGAGADWGSDVS